MSESFRQLTNISTKCLPEVGDSVLWRGVRSGPRGNPSTKCEYFDAKVRHLHIEKGGELYLYVD